MKSRALVFCSALTLVIVACSASDESSTPLDTPSATAAPDETPAVTSSADPATTASSTPDAARILSVDPDAFVQTDALFEEMRAAFEANEFEPTREIALQQFDIAFGTDLGGTPGAFPAAPVDSSDILQMIDEIWDEFTADEQQAIADRVRLEFEAADVGGDGDDDFDDAAASDSEGEGEGLMRPSGFASSQLRQPAPYDQVGPIFREAHRELIGKLGGPPLDYSWSIGDLADADPNERGHIAIWAVQAKPGFLGGLLDDLLDRTCPTVIYPVPGVGRAEMAAAIMHELFHCWSWTNGDRLGYISTPAWFQEGVAMWAGSQFSPSGLGGNWWNVFAARQTFSLYRESYAAIGFWSQLAELLGGEAELWDRIPSFNTSAGLGSNSNLFEFITASLSQTELAALAASALQQPAYGDVWEVSGNDVGVNGRTPVPLTVDASTGFVSDAVSFARQKIVQYQIVAPRSDDPWVLKLSTDGLVATRWSSGDEFTYVEEQTTTFCIGDGCVCPDGSEPELELTRLPDDATSVDVALTGGAVDGAGTTMELAVLDEDCEETDPEPLDLGSGTGNVAGTYRAQPEAVAQMFREASVFGVGEGEGLDIAGSTGDVLLTFRPDGTGRIDYQEVELFFNDGPLTSLTLNGGGEFNYGIDRTLRITGTDYAFSVSTPTLGPDPLTLTSADLPSGGVSEFSYSFAAPTLLLDSLGGTSGEVFFPLVWVKQ